MAAHIDHDQKHQPQASGNGLLLKLKDPKLLSRVGHSQLSFPLAHLRPLLGRNPGFWEKLEYAISRQPPADTKKPCRIVAEAWSLDPRISAVTTLSNGVLDYHTRSDLIDATR